MCLVTRVGVACSVALSVARFDPLYLSLTCPQEQEAAVRAQLTGGRFADVVDVLRKLLSFMDLTNTVCQKLTDR